MEISSIARKLQLKPGHRVTLVNAPPAFREHLEPLPEGAATVEAAPGRADVVLCFARDSAELRHHAATALDSLAPEGMLWFAYPKAASGIPTDLNRDAGWEVVTTAGWEPVRQVAVDDAWSAVRFRRGAVRGTEELLDNHFAGQRAVLRPLFDRLRAALHALGPDVSEGARDSYIAYARRKQFAVVKSRSRPVQVELGLRLPAAETTARLQPVEKNFGSESVTHKVVLAASDEVDGEMLGWLRAAYEGVK